MSKLYTYIVTFDHGFAPNPFWGWCSLAVCTPNHKGSCAQPGDWIAGFSSKCTGYKFIYAMEVDERIHMNNYYNDPRFQLKKPLMSGDWKKRCGDNFYSQLPNGDWVQHPNQYHDRGFLGKDTRVPYVFVGQNFWYLGKDRVDTPAEFLPMVGRRGARVDHPIDLVRAFQEWVKTRFKIGITNNPLDADTSKSCSQKLSSKNKSCKPCDR